MVSRDKNKSTIELWSKLFQAPNIENYISENMDIKLPAFSEYITLLCELKKEKPERIIKKANIDISYGHRLFSGGRNPSRDTVLQFAFAFELSSDETQQLLKIARMAPLHPKVKRDAVIAYYLHTKKSLDEVQTFLYENGLPILGKSI